MFEGYLKQSTQVTVTVLMISSSDHIAGKTGLSAGLTIYATKAGAAPAAITPTVAELDSTNMPGLYSLVLTTTHTNTVGEFAIRVSGSGADPTDVKWQVSARLQDDLAYPATSGRSMVVDANGLVDANTVKIGPTGSGTAQTARDVGASVLLSAGTGTGQLDFTSGVVKANVTQLLGTAWLTPGTAGTPDVNVKLWNGLTTVALPLVPTTAGRTLDVSATGEAGVDWANVGSPTTSVNLSGTTIATTQKVDIETIKTNPVVNAGTVTFPTTATLASTTNITAGTITTATNVTTVNGLAANVITAAATASDFGAEVATAVWQDATAGDFTVASSIGKALYTGNIVPGAAGGLFIAGSNAATTVNFTGSLSGSVGSVTGAVGSVTGNVGGNVTGSVGSVTGNVGGNVTGSVGSIASGGISEASFATTAGTFSPLGIVDQGTAQSATSTTLVLRSAAAFADDELIGCNILITGGSAGVGQVRTITGYVSSTDTATVATWTTTPSGTITYKVLAASASGTPPTAAAIAGAVWDEAISGHAISGSTGEALSAAGAAGDPWITALPGSYSAGQAGYIIGTNVNATISSRATQTSVDTVDDFLDTEIAAIKAKTDSLTFTVAGVVDANTTQWKGSTAPAMTGDAFARLGAPAGASVSADVAAVKADTAAVKTKTDYLPSATAGAAGGVFIAGTNAATTITTALTTTFTGNLTGSVGSVSGLTAATVHSDLDDIQSRLPAALVGGRMDASVGAMAANVMTAAAAAADLTTELQSGLATASALSTLQTSVDDLPTNAELATSQAAADDATLAAIAALPTAAAIADAVWDEAAAGHVAAGSTGEALGAAGAAGDPWITTLPGAYTAGQAGHTIGSLTFTVAGKVDANIKNVNDVEVTGTGESGDEWGPT